MQIPIACSLSGADVRRRLVAWRELLSSGLVDRRRVPGGIRLTARQGAEAALLELVELERACCPWMRVEIQGQGGRAVTLTSDRASGEAALRLMLIASAAGAWTWRRKPVPEGAGGEVER